MESPQAFVRKALLFYLILQAPFALADDFPTLKQQILFLAQKEQIEDLFPLYERHKKELGHHDFEILEQIASVWIEQSAKSASPEKQTLGIFAYSIAGLKAPFDVVESAIASQAPLVQRSALSFLAKMQEDYTEPLLNKAMASPFLETRLEAAYLLAERKSPVATGQIESLMYRLPPQLRAFFPEFFAIIGTSEAINVLRHLMDDASHATRIEAILSAARHGRDDLLPQIRAGATHMNLAEQEACAAALGLLKDMRSVKKLKKLAQHSSPNVQLSALYALYLLGEQDLALKGIKEEAMKENLFAISLFADIPGEEELLATLLRSKNQQVRFNAAFVLLQKKDSRGLSTLLEFLIPDSKDIGFLPSSSIGGSLHAWKVISSLTQHANESFFDIKAMTLAIQEHIIALAIELPEAEFLYLANYLFQQRQTPLIPITTRLLENLGTPGAIELLKKYSQTAGAPLLRLYCNLTLLRLKEKGPYRNLVLEFLRNNHSKELIRFRDPTPRHRQLSDPYKLTPEEHSALLISSYETLSMQQDKEIIDLLLDAIRQGHPSNRPVLAGLLIHTLQ